MKTCTAVLYGLCALATLAVPVTSKADDQDVIDYRQHIMKTLGEQEAAIRQILQHKVPPQGLATQVQILAITASTAKGAFEPKVQGGDSKPEVWTQWSDFAKRLDELTAATKALAKTAEDGGIAATASKIEAALTCKGCHDHYRADQKP